MELFYSEVATRQILIPKIRNGIVRCRHSNSEHTFTEVLLARTENFEHRT